MEKFNDTLEEFFKQVKLRAIKQDDPYFLMNSLLGELGEYANLLKKEKFEQEFDSYRDRIKIEEAAGIRTPRREREIDELGDVFFYLFALLESRKIFLEDILNNQLDKLKRRDERFEKMFKK